MSSNTSTAKAAALDGLDIALASLHSYFPGTTGANEISGGGYVRKTITVGAASGGQRLMASAVVFDVPACTVNWISYRNTAGIVLFSAPNGGATPRNFMALPGADTIYAASHGYADAQKVVLYLGAPPAPFVEGVIYFVRDSTAHTFKLAETLGGAAVMPTSPAEYSCSVCAVTEDVYVGADTHTLSTSSFTSPG